MISIRANHGIINLISFFHYCLYLQCQHYSCENGMSETDIFSKAFAIFIVAKLRDSILVTCAIMLVFVFVRL